MAYKENIAEEIRKLFRDAPPGTSEYDLEHFNQNDVKDTVNYLSTLHPNSIETTADIPIQFFVGSFVCLSMRVVSPLSKFI